MKSRKLACFLGVLSAACCLAGEPQTQQNTLRSAAKNRVLIGTALASWDLRNPALAKIVAEQFSCITPENEMKPQALQSTKGQFNFQRADVIADFAKQHGQMVIGHTLCWHQQCPKWFFEDEKGNPLGREQALANLHDHIQTVMTHFKGRVHGWDVVNEVIDDNPEKYLRNTPARRAIGDDYILKAFEFAHQADPDAELYYNDYGIERGSKLQHAIRLVREIKAAGLRIDGVGVQGHFLLDFPATEAIESGVKALSELNVQVMITELDVDPLPRQRANAGADLNAQEKSADPYKQGLPDELQKQLALRYQNIISGLLKNPHVTRITIWGTHDGRSWLNDWPVRGRTNHALLWDRQLQPKPAYFAVRDALSDLSNP